MVSYGGGQSTAGAFYIVRRDHAHRIVPECYLLSQESPKQWPGSDKSSSKSLDGSKIEKVLSELTMPANQSLVGKEGKKMTSEFEKKVLKEVQRYEHRIFQEMDPETAEELQQSENEVRSNILFPFFFPFFFFFFFFFLLSSIFFFFFLLLLPWYEYLELPSPPFFY
jgi:hypothetical protein